LDSSLFAEIVRVAPTLHEAGTFSANALTGLLRHASERPISHSVETGSGASTLVFSHLSGHHTVFAMDGGTNSIRSIEDHSLIRKTAVTFVEGPTQLTLPVYRFQHALQLALIDGPHGYPFPDLEYYYIYPHLERDALLIVDDIHIPTITNLFDFLTADEMFVLREVIETTAFFRRTDAPIFLPTGDGWWLQRYNKRAFESAVLEKVAGPEPRRVDSSTAFYLDRFGSTTDPLRVESLQVPHDVQLTLSGWALDTQAGRPAAAVHIALDGTTYRGPVNAPRGDVATAYANQAYFRCGFNVHFPDGVLTPGSHDMEISVVLRSELECVLVARIRFLAQ
jgi:hypothetical protein